MRPSSLTALVALLAVSATLSAGAEAAGHDKQEALLRIVGPVTVAALAVEETPEGFVGVHATVQATVLAGGSGHVFVSTKPLAQADMQGSARLAAQVAAATLGLDWRGQDYLVSFTSGSPVIGGPSAGAVMALALTTALHNLAEPDAPWSLDASVAATGTINPDGTIGPVGGVPAKAEAAKAAGVTTFLYPAGLDRATTLVSENGRLVVRTVDMARHCEALGITCRAVARLEELVTAATGVDLERPEVPVPGTLDYAAVLAPGVEAQVAGLQSRMDRLSSGAAYESLRAADRARIQPSLEAARGDLAAAQAALAAGQYYRAATESFQGSIQVGIAENLTAFHASGRSEVVVRRAISDCERAVADAEEAALVPAEDYNALYALGAAQGRMGDARALRDQARADRASSLTWTASLENSAFCRERALTVLWWADLRHAFPAGPPLEDAAATAQQAFDDAWDLVSYAEAVLAQAGSSEALRTAQGKLQGARAALEDGLHPAATVLAVEAASLASVAVQVGADAQVPDVVLRAAEQGAARAIDAARSRGIEPILSVSLVELAQAQQGADRLHSYWTARSLALLDVVGAPAQNQGGDGSVAGVGWQAQGRYSGGTLVAFLVVGVVLGLAASGLLVVVLMGRR